ncbi:M23 family metallopeptidase [Actinoplanes teichomyceticus]|uniref:M23 family metallopeptidase n=1 Tax=Actinoplanes teichomyceticus TaxID=1867 RepID=UPI001EF35811|nr:M23 family metallopeptidase [Actinoplanes teichomyceticus]
MTVAGVLLSGCAATGGPGSTAGPGAAAPAVATTPVAAVTTLDTAATAASARRYAFPVAAKNVSWHETHSGYRATDIFAACGSKVVATTTGVVLEISRTDRYRKGKDGPYNGGLFVSILGDDGVRYYGSHLKSVTKGIKKGVRVKVGQQIGKVGRTGNASGVCHLHYGISPACARVGDWTVRRGVVWPYPYLKSWRKGGQKSPVAAVKAWRKKHGCKA